MPFTQEFFVVAGGFFYLTRKRFVTLIRVFKKKGLEYCVWSLLEQSNEKHLVIKYTWNRPF